MNRKTASGRLRTSAIILIITGGACQLNLSLGLHAVLLTSYDHE